MSRKMKTLVKDSIFAATLLTGVVDKRTTADMNKEKLGLAVLPIAMMASVFTLMALSAFCILFRIG